MKQRYERHSMMLVGTKMEILATLRRWVMRNEKQALLRDTLSKQISVGRCVTRNRFFKN